MATHVQEERGIPRSVLRHRPLQADVEVQTWMAQTPRATRGKQQRAPHTTGGPPSLVRKQGVALLHNHPFLIGISMLLTLMGLCLFQAVSTWISTSVDDVRFGRPRTFQMDAFVGHEKTGQASHFVVLNLKGQIEIIELPGGDATHARIFLGPQLYGPRAELVPATLSFLDTQQTHRPDMVVQVQGSFLRFHNTGETFEPEAEKSFSASSFFQSLEREADL